jgi:hypothetical protein
MQAHDDTLLRQRVLEESIEEFEIINNQLANLLLRKEELTEEIISCLGHEHEGQRTYEHNIWKIEVKTPCIYSLNKKLYESGNFKLPSEFNPIKESISYSIDKKLCDQFILDAPKKIKKILAELIDKKPGKAGIAIRARV